MSETKINGEDKAGNEKHNLESRAATIRKGFNDIYEVETEIARLSSTHIEPLKEKRKKMWRQLKADTDIAQNILKLEYKPYKVVRDAREMFEDEDEADKLLDDMKEVHAALHAGEMVDWIAVIEGTRPAQISLNTRA